MGGWVGFGVRWLEREKKGFAEKGRKRWWWTGGGKILLSKLLEY